MHKSSNEDKAIRIQIGKRLKFARVKLNRLQLDEASFRIFGVRKPDRLLKREDNPKESHSETFLLKACEVYGVSLAFLYAQTNNPEYDRAMADQMALVNGIRSDMHDYVKGFALAIVKASLNTTSPKKLLVELAETGQDFEQQVRRTIEINQRYFDCKVKNGAKLIDSMNRFNRSLNEAMAYKMRTDNEIDFDDKNQVMPLLDAIDIDFDTNQQDLFK
jgi:hypothetical protein